MDKLRELPIIPSNSLQELLEKTRYTESAIIAETPFGACLVVSIPWWNDRGVYHCRKIGYPISPEAGPQNEGGLCALQYDPRGYPSATEVSIVRQAMAQGCRHVWTYHGDVVEVTEPAGLWAAWAGD
jgi:hypothetical protein